MKPTFMHLLQLMQNSSCTLEINAEGSYVIVKLICGGLVKRFHFSSRMEPTACIAKICNEIYAMRYPEDKKMQTYADAAINRLSKSEHKR